MRGWPRRARDAPLQGPRGLTRAIPPATEETTVSYHPCIPPPPPRDTVPCLPSEELLAEWREAEAALDRETSEEGEP